MRRSDEQRGTACSAVVVMPTSERKLCSMDRYPPIADHGLIGDLQTTALVTTDGTIDWFCCPRFDSPSIFAALLDRRRGGEFLLPSGGPNVVSQQVDFPGASSLRH